MIKSYGIAITEIDDVEEAVKQAAEQADALALLANTMGIVCAHPEFVSSGIFAEVSKKLPFPTIGMTSMSHGAGGTVDSYLLSVLVLTSDDCAFSCGLSDAVPARRDAAEFTRECYENTLGGLPGAPKLAITYAPFLDSVRVSDYVVAMTEINGDLPLFGAIANYDMGSDAPEGGARVLFCGEAYKDRFALALVSGPVNPKFYIASITEEVVLMPDIGVITAADKNTILEINNQNAAKFLKNAGFLNHALAANDKGMLSCIFVLRLNGERDNGEILSRIPTEISEAGVTCGGRILTGATLSIAFNTKDSVLETAEQLIKEIRSGYESGTALIHSCLGRRFGLLNEPMKELELMRGLLGSGFNYTAMYANGEICPIATGPKGVHNQDHNQTLTACVI